MWCAALSHAMSRFEGCRPLYKQARSGGVGSFTADNFPVFDYLKPNVYGILDSNHGYKMIGVGREVARVLCGDSAPLLTPFRFERFATGDLHPVSNSPYPWSLSAGVDARACRPVAALIRDGAWPRRPEPRQRPAPRRRSEDGTC